MVVSYCILVLFHGCDVFKLISNYNLSKPLCTLSGQSMSPLGYYFCLTCSLCFILHILHRYLLPLVAIFKRGKVLCLGR